MLGASASIIDILFVLMLMRLNVGFTTRKIAHFAEGQEECDTCCVKLPPEGGAYICGHWIVTVVV